MISFASFGNQKYVNTTLIGQRVDKSEIENTSGQIPVLDNIIKKGNCIHCSAKIHLDLNKPLCSKCYRSWIRNADQYLTQNYCISCGEKKEVTFIKPACYPCYKKLDKVYLETNNY